LSWEYVKEDVMEMELVLYYGFVIRIRMLLRGIFEYEGAVVAALPTKLVPLSSKLVPLFHFVVPLSDKLVPNCEHTAT
jgi:hypothetical protein